MSEQSHRPKAVCKYHRSEALDQVGWVILPPVKRGPALRGDKETIAVSLRLQLRGRSETRKAFACTRTG